MLPHSWLAALPLSAGPNAALRMFPGGVALVSVGTDGVSFPDDELCASDCYLKSYQKSNCAFNSTESVQCACDAGDFSGDILGCVQTNCPQFRDELAGNVTAVCDTPSPPPDDTTLRLTPQQACQFNCGLKAFSVTQCPAVSMNSDCVCKHDQYFPTLNQCLEELCPPSKDIITANIQEDCNATGGGNSGTSPAAPTSSSTSASGSGTAISQTSPTSAPPEDAGASVHVPSLAAAIAALLALVTTSLA